MYVIHTHLHMVYVVWVLEPIWIPSNFTQASKSRPKPGSSETCFTQNGFSCRRGHAGSCLAWPKLHPTWCLSRHFGGLSFRIWVKLSEWLWSSVLEVYRVLFQSHPSDDNLDHLTMRPAIWNGHILFVIVHTNLLICWTFQVYIFWVENYNSIIES